MFRPTGRFVADKLTAVDFSDAGEDHQHVIVTERLRQIVDNEVGFVDCSR